MIISSINNISPSKILNNKNTITSNKVSVLENDVFERKNISFGYSYDDYFNYENEDELTSTIRKEIYEIKLQHYLNVFTDKNIQNKLMSYKKMKISDFNNMYNVEALIDKKFLNEFLDGNGIKTLAQLQNFIKFGFSNKKTKNVFNYQNIEALEIYGLLNSKDSLNKYPQMLLYLYKTEKAKPEPNFDKLNTYSNFLKEMGLSNFDNFNIKFSHLKPKFNDFESITDQIDAIDYMMDTYDDKIDYLNKLINSNSRIVKKDARTLYKNQNDIVECIYGQKDSKSFYNYSSLMDLVFSSDKFSRLALKNVEQYFNNFENPEDKLEFYKLLKSCNVTISEFNNLCSKTILSDCNPVDNIINKEIIPENLSKFFDSDKQKANEFYLKFGGIVNALCEQDNLQGFSSLLKIIDKYELKTQDDILKFYNKCSNTKQKSITSKELTDFIELFNYAPDENVIQRAKTKNVSAVEYLKLRKEEFKNFEGDISQFLSEDNTGYFAGKKLIEIFNKYKEAIRQNPKNISTTLKNIVDFNISGSEEYNNNLAQINKFLRHFPDRKSVLRFISDNNISFENTKEASEYRENCLEILDILNDKNNIKQSQKRIKQISESRFLPSSESGLTTFLKGFNTLEEKREILNIIADRKVPSLRQWHSFLIKYKAQKGSYDKDVVKYFNSIDENINFKSITQHLDTLQKEIDKYGIDAKITAQNMSAAKIDLYNPQDFYNMLNNLISNGNEKANFISSLPYTFKETGDNYNAFQIANEIVDQNILTHNNKYENIPRLLGINNVINSQNQIKTLYSLIEIIKSCIPQKFIDFVNSNEWLDFSSEGKIPNISLHAKLRAIDRFALADAKTIDELYSDKTKNLLQDLFRTIYIQTPKNVKRADKEDSNRLVVYTKNNKDKIKTVFTNKGSMITVVKRN